MHKLDDTRLKVSRKCNIKPHSLPDAKAIKFQLKLSPYKLKISYSSSCQFKKQINALKFHKSFKVQLQLIIENEKKIHQKSLWTKTNSVYNKNK